MPSYNVPTDLVAPDMVAVPNHRLSLRTIAWEEGGEQKHARDVEILAIGWEHGGAEKPFAYLAFDSRAGEDERIYWIRGDYVQQIRRA